jgi:two-component system chemotaxis response regulator CheY
MEKAMDSPFDMILADINMPIMNGYDMVAALRKEITAQSVPIVMSSTESKDHDMAQAYAAGANLYLVKPVQPDILQHYVKFIIGEVT